MSEDLRSLPNIGKVAASSLEAVGIHTPDELRRVGSKEAFLRLRANDPGACLSMLQGLEGAVRGIRWHLLDAETKTECKEFFNNIKNGSRFP